MLPLWKFRDHGNGRMLSLVALACATILVLLLARSTSPEPQRTPSLRSSLTCRVHHDHRQRIAQDSSNWVSPPNTFLRRPLQVAYSRPLHFIEPVVELAAYGSRYNRPPPAS
jgi:hypothetical protein